MEISQDFERYFDAEENWKFERPLLELKDLLESFSVELDMVDNQLSKKVEPYTSAAARDQNSHASAEVYGATTYL